LREKTEKDVRYANITITEGHGASQYRLFRSAGFRREFGLTLSLPSAVGRGGVTVLLPLKLSHEERRAMLKSGSNLKAALERVKKKD
jgi:L-lactate dehydrogenase